MLHPGKAERLGALSGAGAATVSPMPNPPLLMWSEELLEYNFGAAHPMAPIRLALTHKLLTALAVDDDMVVAGVPLATRDELERVHTPDYIDAVQAAGTGTPAPQYGLGEDDNPIFAGIHDAGARLVGSTLHAARAVWRGDAPRALSLAGGMHHAMPGRAAGFCIYNDLAVAIADLLADGAARVAYVDIDAHHGDGVERAFWDDDRVLTISLHQHPGSLFPGTGYVQDLGGRAAHGYAVNVPLPAGTGDEGWLRSIDGVVEPLLREFAPEVLITQHGCDTHARDPLAELEVSVDAQREAAIMLAGYAEAYAAGRWVATGGGGYEITGVVPRVWTHLAAVVAGRPLDVTTPVPEEWRNFVMDLAEVPPPTTMGDGQVPVLRAWEEGYNPSDPIDRVIMSVRNAAFPFHGIDPFTG